MALLAVESYGLRSTARTCASAVIAACDPYRLGVGPGRGYAVAIVLACDAPELDGSTVYFSLHPKGRFYRARFLTTLSSSVLFGTR